MSGRGFGDWVIRRSLDFVGSEKCKRIRLLKSVKDEKPIMFRGRERAFYSVELGESDLRLKLLPLLTRLQSNILDKFTALGRSFFYFSLYELRKMLPYPGVQVDYSAKRLCELGLLKMVNIGATDFFVEPRNASRLLNMRTDAIIEDVTEFRVANKIHELIMNMYPRYMIERFKGALRPSSSRILRLTGGMAFDMFYPFSDPVGNKEFLAVDVYTRIPVSGYIVNSFKKKIEWAPDLRERTFGMIMFRNSTPTAIEIALKLGIRFTHLSKINIDYGTVRREVSEEMLSQNSSP